MKMLTIRYVPGDAVDQRNLAISKKKKILTVVESFILTAILLFWKVCKGQYGKRKFRQRKTFISSGRPEL